MINFIRFSCFLPLLFVMACSTGQTTFYWYKPETGITYFAKDHNSCLYESDYWAYEAPNIGIPPAPETYDLRLRSESDSGIWAFYVALPGSQPVYVNSKTQGQWSMSVSDYYDCMQDRGYKNIYEPVEDPRIGLKTCNMTGCYDPVLYNSVRERYSDENGMYRQDFNRNYHGDKPYTSHYYGADSTYFYDRQYNNYR